LRNPSRKGIGFFETKNFYPDFVLWTIKCDLQTITFIDPKGLVMVDYDDEKLGLCKRIKAIEAEVNKREGIKIKLNSFILAHNYYDELRWNISKEELNNKNILFLKDDGIKAIGHLFRKIEES